MWKRRSVIVAIAALAVGAALTPLAFRRRHSPAVPPVSYEQYARIKRGMTLGEVEAAIGAPAGDYRTENVITLLPSLYEGEGWQLFQASWWQGNKGTIVVLSSGGRVEGAQFYEVKPAPRRYVPF